MQYNKNQSIDIGAATEVQHDQVSKNEELDREVSSDAMILLP